MADNWLSVLAIVRAIFYTFNLIGPIAPISFFLRTSEETNCAARLATPILTAASLLLLD